MESESMRRRAALPLRLERIEWGAVGVWVLGFALVVYLGLEGGGFDPLVHDQVGIAVWWVVLAGALVGVLPRLRLSASSWLPLALFALLAAWTALSFAWTESAEQTWAETARIAGYLGVFALALTALGREGARRIGSAVAAGIVVVALVGLLSRLQPSWFPEAAQTANFLESGAERLSYPLDYWNALAALVAIGLPLLLHQAACARTPLGRGLAAAAMPALALTAFFTLSRGGIGASVAAVGVYLLLASDRLPKLLSLLVTGAGGLVLVLAANGRDALQDGLTTPSAAEQGDEMLLLTILICLAVGMAQAVGSTALAGERRPRWSRVSRRPAATGAGVLALIALVGLLAAGAPGEIADGWEEFKQPDSAGKGADRLSSAAGQSRYQYWSSAVRENATAPLIGTGAGTFKYWWPRDGDNNDSIRDAHSLYMQTLGELGIVGLAMLAAFLASVLAIGVANAFGASSGERSALAAALAGCVAFSLSAVVDWIWQIPVLPVSLLLLAAGLVAARSGSPGSPTGWPLRVGAAAAALVAIVAIAIPLTSTGLLRESEADARAGDLIGALEAAENAESVQPSAATPYLQQALVQDERGELGAASKAARKATEREPTNWRTWLVLSRIEAERGRAVAAVSAYEEARSLNPRFVLFAR